MNDAAAMGEETAYAETEDGRRQRARHDVMRRLLDEPVVYYAELAPAGRAWLEHSLGYVTAMLASELGLVVERRREGVAAVDPDGDLTDRLFPDAGSTLKHAALLVAEAWTAKIKEKPELACLDVAAIGAMLASAAATHAERCQWAKAYRDATALPALTEEVLTFMASIKMARFCGGTAWEALPVMARFAAAELTVGRRKT